MKSFFVTFALIGVLPSTAILPYTRPPPERRTFHSPVIENLIDNLAPLFLNEDIGVLFVNNFPNTLDTTIYSHERGPLPDSFVITGDIFALWLRDSMNQLLPYIPYGKNDSNIQLLVEGLINRQARSILIDPFANAFNYNSTGDPGPWQNDQRTPPMSSALFEGKYEIDSLAAFFKLSYWHYWFSGDEALNRFASPTWLQAVKTALDTVAIMQEDNGRSENPPYRFNRYTKDALDTLPVQGRGHPGKPFGLSKSMFRPSDDQQSLPYHIAGNAMMCVELKHLNEMLTRGTVGVDLISYASQIRDKICNALIPLTSRTTGLIPYEVDGFGAEYYMDDANVPSLLSLPVLGYMSSKHPAYQTTRRWLLSENPYFFEGNNGSGIGGPHFQGVNYTWHMAVAMQAMTSNDDDEIAKCLNILATTTAGTGMMHESFNVNNPTLFARKWFAWASGVFGEMVLQLIKTKPHLVLKNDPAAIARAQSLVQPTVSLAAQMEAEA